MMALRLSLQHLNAASEGVLTLFHAAHSTCSQKVRLCLAEKQLPYDSRILQIKKSEHLSPEYLKINPNGVVPTLVHRGCAVIDSSVICEYLDEVYEEPRLSPEVPLERAKMRSWLRYLEEVPTAAIRLPSFNLLFAPIIAALGGGRMEELARQSPLRRDLYERIGPAGFSEEETAGSLRALRQTLKRAEEALERGSWLNGDAFSLVDIVFTPIAVRMEDLGLTYLWEDLPRVNDWYGRILSRESFGIAYFPGSRISPQNPNIH